MIKQLGKQAKQAKYELAKLSKTKKNDILKQVSENLLKRQEEIINENKKDMAYAKQKGLHESLLNRLLLDKSRIQSMVEGLQQLITLEDPIGTVENMVERPNGLLIGKKRVPIGVIGIIYEARPNVTIDAFGLCFKTNNVVLLRGGKEAIHSNIKLVDIVRDTLEDNNVNQNAIQIIKDTDRRYAEEMMRLNEYLDVLIPRGGASLIKRVVEHSTVPVIETGSGNCHLYIDEFADIEKAINISVNAKIQRPAVCNSCESILVHKSILGKYVPKLKEAFQNKVEIRGDSQVCDIIDYAAPATEEDYYTEYHDYIVSVKIVDSLDEAIHHINKYSTGHSESIITEKYAVAQKFLNEVDSAAVYVNASTRFTDGFEFGFGAEIGISTQKLHARGPLGLKELTTNKYIIYGNGQIR